MTVIFDTDILSAFAKADALQPLKKLFSKHDVYITPEIYEELSIPVDYGTGNTIFHQWMKLLYHLPKPMT